MDWERYDVSTLFTISGLRPNTPYTVVVTSHNGVSDQDFENEALRRVSIHTKTSEGGECQLESFAHYLNSPPLSSVPTVPVGAQVFSGVALVCIAYVYKCMHDLYIHCTDSPV